MPLLTTVVLMRHGETDWNAIERCQGSADIPLNAKGMQEVDHLATRLQGVVFDAAFTSPLVRAKATAERLVAVPARVVREFAELSYGTATGTAPATWPDNLRERWLQTPWDVLFDEGESLAMLRDRAVPAWDEIVNANRGRTILVSGHGHVNRILLLHATQGDPRTFWDIPQPNGHVVVVKGNAVQSLDDYLGATSLSGVTA